jgi:hypothetical protein
MHNCPLILQFVLFTLVGGYPTNIRLNILACHFNAYCLETRARLICKQREKRISSLEKIILNSNNSECMMQYARDVIKGRWPEAEPYLMKTPYFWTMYSNSLLEIEK